MKKRLIGLTTAITLALVETGIALADWQPIPLDNKTQFSDKCSYAAIASYNDHYYQ